MLTFSALLFC